MRMISCLVLALAISGVAAGEEAIAARINGVTITVAQFERYFEEWLDTTGKNPGAIRSPALYKRFRRQALTELLDEELLGQEAKRARIAVPRKQVDAARARLRAQFPSREAYLRRLERAGFTEATYVEHLERQLSIQLWIEHEFGSGHAAQTKLEEKLRALRAAASIEVPDRF